MGPRRYSDLLAKLPGIPTNVLASRLKELEEEEDGLTVPMPVTTLHRIALTDGQRRLLLARARRSSGEHRDVLRARIVLAAADGATNAAIARDVAVGVDTVRKWRRRFSEHGMDGLRDLPRSGRPRTFDATVVAEVKAMACELPADSDTPLEHQTGKRHKVQPGDGFGQPFVVPRQPPEPARPAKLDFIRDRLDRFGLFL